jgi:hypothetical protein
MGMYVCSLLFILFVTCTSTVTSLSGTILTQATPKAENGISQIDRENENSGLGQEENMSAYKCMYVLFVDEEILIKVNSATQIS